MMRRIGITGGIGSGKSVVSHLLRIMGYPVYDSDTEARRLMQSSPEIRQRLSARFGDDIYIGEILNRPLLAKRAFGNPEQMARLNAIVHPVVLDDFVRWSERHSASLCFVESAIMYESGFDRLVDEVWAVTAPEALRIKRVMRRNGLSERAIRERMAAQMSEPERLKRATRVLVNDEETSVIQSLVALLNLAEG